MYAGVSVDHVRLEDVGIHGNGHMMFMEKNNMHIADDVVMMAYFLPMAVEALLC
jgi:hypothetical protein